MLTILSPVHPEIVTIGPLTIHSFGLMIALGMLAAGWFVRRDLAERGLPPRLVVDLVVAAAIGGAVGARGYYLLEHAGEQQATLTSSSGLTWYGGVIGGVLAVAGVARLRRVPLGQAANVCAPALALAYAIGRIGCQLAGDGTYGQPSDLPWAMSYPNGEVPTTIAVHPTPLYEVVAMLVVFVVLWRLRDRLKAPWSLAALYLVLAGVERLLVEFIRINPVEALGLTAPQLFSVAQIAVGIAILASLVVSRRPPLSPVPG